jgi:hypothetical protein
MSGRKVPDGETNHVEPKSSPNPMAGAVMVSNPNPVENVTNPNQKFRHNLKSDSGKEGKGRTVLP